MTVVVTTLRNLTSASAPDVPYDIAFADSGIFATFGHAIKKFNTRGGFLTQWANVETSVGFIQQPGGIALSGDTVFVFDELNTQVQIYSKLGVFPLSLGCTG